MSGHGSSAMAGLAGVLVATAVLVGWPSAIITGLPRPAGRTAGRPGGRRDRPNRPRLRALPGRRAPGHRRRDLDVVPVGVLADLVVALLEAGLPAESTLELLRARLAAAGLAEPKDLDSIHDALDLSARTGAAPSSSVRASAAEHRRRELAARAEAAQRLGVLVVLPTGLCLLPSFLVLTVVPLALALLGGLG